MSDDSSSRAKKTRVQLLALTLLSLGLGACSVFCKEPARTLSSLFASVYLTSLLSFSNRRLGTKRRESWLIKISILALGLGAGYSLINVLK